MEPAFEEMSAKQRIRFVQDLWDRIAAQPDDVPVTKAMKQELDRRLADHQANPDDVVDWETVQKKSRRK